MKRFAIGLFACTIVLALLGLSADFHEPAVACGGAGPRGFRMEIGEESAIILWDSTSKMQHFIRRATFNTDTPDFGFLVPTPTRPTLSEAKDAAFVHLANLTAPEIITKPQYVFDFAIGCGAGGRFDAKSAAGGVHVLEQSRVAGFDYAVLAADNAEELNDWLAKNKYVTRPDLTSWLETYVKEKWRITAFKIAKDAGKKEVSTAAVCMSFKSDTPFFPYSEPADQRESAKDSYGRVLRVFFLSDRRYEGKLPGTVAWPGKTIWAGAMASASAPRFGGLLDPMIGDMHTYLTMFEDRSSPRPGTADITFSPSAVQDDVRLPPIIHTVPVNLAGWVCLGAVVLLVLLPVVHFFRRGKGIRASRRDASN